MRVIDKVKKLFATVREQYPQITDDLLIDDGAIWYMNGNDGTRFDWNVNDSLCEFFIFWKETHMGFIKVLVKKDNTATAYIYPTPTTLHGIKIDMGEFKNAVRLKNMALKNADDKRLFDRKIDEIEWRC